MNTVSTLTDAQYILIQFYYRLSFNMLRPLTWPPSGRYKQDWNYQKIYI